MIRETRQFASQRRSLRLGFVSLAAVLALAPAALAEDCIDVQSATAEADFKPCEETEPQLDFSTIAVEPASPAQTVAPSDSVPWIATDPRDVPANFSTSDTGVSVRTSLGTWRDYNARSASPTLQQSDFAPASDALSLPKAPVAPKTPIDVWSNLDVQGYEGARDQSTRAGIGADYQVSRSTIVGVSLEHGDARSATTSGTEQDQKASAYVTLQASPLLSLDARTEWQAGNSEFAASSGAAEKGAVILAPKVNHSFKLDDGTTLSPYLTYQREFDVSTARKETVDPTFDAAQSAGAGVTYTKPDAYSLSLSADVDNFGAADEAQSLSSKFQLSVPLR